MAAYDEFITQLQADTNDVYSQKAARIISNLQDMIRHHNSDDELFDDEKSQPEKPFEHSLAAVVTAEVILETIPSVVGSLVEVGVGALDVGGEIIGAVAEGVGSVLEGVAGIAEGISSIFDIE